MGLQPGHTGRDWLLSLKNGEEEGFNYFFREHYAALCYFSFHFIKDKEEAETIAADAFMKLWERHANFENAQSIKSFLYTAAKNASLNWLRDKKKKGEREKEFAHFSGQDENSVFTQIVQAELYREIFIALDTLPPKCRQIFRMLFIEGKDYKQVAEELNLSVDTIRNQKARGLMLLKQRVAFGIFLCFLVVV